MIITQMTNAVRMLIATLLACVLSANANAESQLYFVHTDHLGTPQVVTDKNQNVVWKGEYTPFGEVKEVVNTLEQNVRFPGQYFDQETGLHYNYFRDYDTSIGRYLQSDPIGLEGGINTYAYALGNPIMNIDFFGLRTEVTIWHPVGYGGSSFGHVSVDVNGTAYSYGDHGMWSGSATDYFNKNDFRDGQGVVVPLTPDQEVKLQQCLSKDHGEYNAVSNNCGSPIQDCLKELGIDTGDKMFPVDLGNSLLDNGALPDDKTQHPATNPSEESSAPWAR